MKDTAMTAKTKKKDNPTDNVAKTAEAMVAAGQEALRNFAKSSTEGYENAFAGVRGKAGDLVQGYDELAVSGKDNMEAWSTAGAAYGKGLEAIGGEWMSFAKKMLDGNVKVTKAVLGAKPLNEVLDLQSDFARSSYEGLLDQSIKVGELATKVAQDAFEPIKTHITATVEKRHKNAV